MSHEDAKLGKGADRWGKAATPHAAGPLCAGRLLAWQPIEQPCPAFASFAPSWRLASTANGDDEA